MRYFIAACCLMMHALVAAAPADNYPDHSIRFLVGYAPGGATDISARILAEHLGPILGQSVVVENRAGATGNIAAEMAARAAPDGYTIYLGTAIIAVSANLFKNLSYDPVKDLTPIANYVEAQTILASSMAFPPKSLQELVAYAKANPGKVSYASSGDGGSPHLAGVLLSKQAGISMLHVPYKGGTPGITDMLAGRVDISFSNPASVLAHIKAGKLRALAVVGDRRFAELPDVPTMAEEGYKDFNVNAWYGVMGPANLPASIVAKLNAAVLKVMAEPEVRSALAKQGLTVLPPNTPAQFGALVKSNVAMYAKLLKDAGIQPQ